MMSSMHGLQCISNHDEMKPFFSAVFSSVSIILKLISIQLVGGVGRGGLLIYFHELY